MGAREGNGGRGNNRRALKPLASLVPYILRYRGMLAGGLLALVISALATLAVPLGVRRMIDLGFASSHSETVDSYFTAMFVIGLVLALASAARFYFVNWLGERVVADLRADLFAHLTRLSPDFYDRNHSGEIMSRLTADTTQIKAAVGTSVSQALRNTIMAVGSVVMMIVTSFQLAGLVLLAIPLILVPLIALGRSVRNYSRSAQDELAASSLLASETLASIRTLQASSYESTIVSRFRQAVERTFDATRVRMQARAGLTALAIFLVFSSIIGVLWIGAQQVFSGDMTGGTLGQFVLYAALAAGAMGGLSEIWGEVQQTAGAAERLAELKEADALVRDPAHPKAFRGEAPGRIRFDGVSFSYPSRPEHKALREVSFEIEPGESVAIVGASGAGKSTVFGLLLRFYDASSGSVLVDGLPVDEVRLADLRKRMALVPQDITLFANTVAANIGYGVPGASREQILAASKAAHADEFISALDDGYDTLLGEKGTTLSGGQRQRIAIARAVLRDAPILLLDEATSALDTVSEQHVQAALEKLEQGRTTLIIAHRLSTVQKVDRILVMKDGRISEKGTHAELMKSNGDYRELAALQFGETS